MAGILAATHNSPQPLAESGHTFPTRVAPFIRYALSFSPYIYWSLPFTIPIPSALQSSTRNHGCCKRCPRDSFLLISWNSYINSRCCYVRFCIQQKAAFTLTPLPENVAALPGARPLAPTHIARLEVPGIVNVYSGDGLKILLHCLMSKPEEATY